VLTVHYFIYTLQNNARIGGRTLANMDQYRSRKRASAQAQEKVKEVGGAVRFSRGWRDSNRGGLLLLRVPTRRPGH
jgi:hypothetical protein